MTTRPERSIAHQLNAAQLAISNSLTDSEIQALVAAYGYLVARLQQGQTLYDTALASVNAAKAAAGAQQSSTRELVKAELTARDAYQALAKVARAVFVSDRAQLTSMGLRGATPKSTAGFLATAYALFNNARGYPELAANGYNDARINAELAKVVAFDTANQKQEAAKGAAQQATIEKDEALKALRTWIAQYRKIARVALRDKPQLLEKLGVAARTSPTKAQREARRRSH